MKNIRALLGELGSEAVVEFLSMLPQELDPLVSEMVMGTAEQDLQRVARARHTLRGLASSIGANVMTDAVNALRNDVVTSPSAEFHVASLQQARLETLRAAEDLVHILKTNPESLGA